MRNSQLTYDRVLQLKYIFYRYVFVSVIFWVIIAECLVILSFVTPFAKSLPRKFGALVFTLSFEIIYLSIPMQLYLFFKFLIKKIRELYERYHVGEGDRVVMRIVTKYEKELEMAKTVIAVLTFLYAIGGIIWGYYFYTHWPWLLKSS